MADRPESAGTCALIPFVSLLAYQLGQRAVLHTTRPTHFRSAKLGGVCSQFCCDCLQSVCGCLWSAYTKVLLDIICDKSPIDEQHAMCVFTYDDLNLVHK